MKSGFNINNNFENDCRREEKFTSAGMSSFQIILLAVFSVLLVVAVLMFSGILPGFKGKGVTVASNISMWGTLSGPKLNALIGELNTENKKSFFVTYKRKRASTYQNDLVNALASGSGPDIWIMSQDILLWAKDKLQPLSFESFPERSFRDTFFDSADLFLDVKNKNILAMPIAVDPLVLYWNRELFSSAGLARAPENWDEFLASVQSLTKRDNAGNITQAGAAIGEFRNVKNAKDILSMLILQAGNKIVDPVSLGVVLGNPGKAPLSPAENSIRFFNEFSDPGKLSYTWNRALPASETMFVNGNLAMYFGYASELNGIKEMNPHLDFDVAPVPQIKGSSAKATFGKIYALAVSKASPRKQAAFTAIFKMMGGTFSAAFAKDVSMVPVRRDLLAKGNDSVFSPVFFKSAIMAKAWLEPDPGKVFEIFKNMVESVATGAARPSESVREARGQIEELIKQYAK